MEASGIPKLLVVRGGAACGGFVGVVGVVGLVVMWLWLCSNGCGCGDEGVRVLGCWRVWCGRDEGIDVVLWSQECKRCGWWI